MPLDCLDSFASGVLDANKWKVLELPAGGGNTWLYEDPSARVRADNGVLVATVEEFQLRHDQVQMFDNPKLLLVMQQSLPVSEAGITTISCDMACDTHNGNPDDLLDGFASFSIADFATGMVFDFIVSSTRIGVVYERLALPGVTPLGGDWIYIVQSPLVAQNASGEFHHYEIKINRRSRTCEWLVDGKRMYFTTDIPVDMQSIVPGVGLLTLKPIVPGRGSVSNHGQGATGQWKNLMIRTT